MHSPAVSKGTDFIFYSTLSTESVSFLLTRQVEDEYIHVTHLRQYVDAFIAASEGQVEHRAASVGHGRGLQLQHQIRAVGLGQRRLGVLLWTHHMERLQEANTGGSGQLLMAERVL